MSRKKRRFTLHAEYKRKIPGTDQDEIPMEVISPMISDIASFVLGVLIVVPVTLALVGAVVIVVIQVLQRTATMDQGTWLFSIFLYFGVVWLTWMLVQDLRQFLYARRHRAALAVSDLQLRGKITHVFLYDFSKYSSNHSVRIWYQFQAPDRTILKGFTSVSSLELKGKDQPSVGMSVNVLYSQESGGHMML